MGPGNGQCVGPAPSGTKIQNMGACNSCFADDTYNQNFYNDTQNFCGDGYGSSSSAANNDIVAINYGNPRYSCDSPGIVTDYTGSNC